MRKQHPRPKSGIFGEVRPAARQPHPVAADTAPSQQPSRKFYRKPTSSDDALALIAEVLRDMDEQQEERHA